MPPTWLVAAVTYTPVVVFGLALGVLGLAWRREQAMTRALDDISINDQEQQQ